MVKQKEDVFGAFGPMVGEKKKKDKKKDKKSHKESSRAGGHS